MAQPGYWWRPGELDGGPPGAPGLVTGPVITGAAEQRLCQDFVEPILGVSQAILGLLKKKGLLTINDEYLVLTLEPL